MASILNRVWSGLDWWDKDENKKQRQQFAQQAAQAPASNGWSVGRVVHDVTHNPVTNAVGSAVQHDVVQPIEHKVIKPIFQLPQTVEHKAMQSSFGRGLEDVGLGAARSGIGTLQGLSGLYDLATPGTGTNRFSKSLDSVAKNIDDTVKNEHLNTGLYKGAQLGSDLLTFATPGIAAKAASYIPKVGKGVAMAGEVLNGGEKLGTKIYDASRAGNFGQRVLGRTAQNVLNPKYQAANAVFTGLQIGKEAGQGQKITPVSVGTNLAIGGLGFPAAGAVGREGAGLAASELRNAAGALPRTYFRGAPNDLAPTWLTRNKALAQEFANDVNGTVHNFALKSNDILDPRRPEHYRRLVNAIGKPQADKLLKRTTTGVFNPADEAAVIKATQKAGFKGGLFDERGLDTGGDTSVLKGNPFSIRVNQTTYPRNLHGSTVARENIGHIQQFAQDHPLGLSMKAVDENGNPVSAFTGKPLNAPKAGSQPASQGKTYYHGTQAPIKSIADLDEMSGRMNSLFGPGIYLTDSKSIAHGYSRTRGKGAASGRVLEGNIGDARLFNLENRLTKDVATIFTKHARNLTDFPEDLPDFTKIKGTDAIREIKKLTPSKEDFDNFFTQELHPYLGNNGFDGFSHIGGVQGGDKHNVAIMFNKQKIRTNVTPNHTDPYNQAHAEAKAAPKQEGDQGKVFYHGTNNPELKSLQDLQAGSGVGKSSRNRVYVTENPEIANNFGKNIVSQRLYGKHLNAKDIGIEKTPGWAADREVAPEFADYKTTPLLTERERRVFENSFVRGIPNNTIIEDTPGVHKYLESKGYTTITVPRVHSDVNGPRTETIVISKKAFDPPSLATDPSKPTQTITDKPRTTTEQPPTPNTPQHHLILKETKPRNGRQDVITAGKNPITGKLETSRRTIDAPKKTGVVDKRLQEIERARKDVINYTADELQGANTEATGSLQQRIGKNGVYVGKDGLPEDFQSLPKYLRSKDPSKKRLDEWAADLGYDSEGALLEALDKSTPTTKMSRAEALAEAERQLASGDHPYSNDYKQITNELKQRQDELSQYPKGTRSQVKVTNKPQKMSDAEFQSLLNTPEGRQHSSVLSTRNPKRTIRHADAERQVIDSLRQGTNTDKVVADYMKATDTHVQQAAADVRRVAREAGIDLPDLPNKNPLSGSKSLPEVHSWQDAVNNANSVRYGHERLSEAIDTAQKQLNKADEELVNRWVRGEDVATLTKEAKNPQAFRDVINTLNRVGNEAHLLSNMSGRNVGYFHRYTPLKLDLEDKATVAKLEEMGINPAKVEASYEKHRIIPNRFAAEKLGLKNKHDNVFDDWRDSLRQRAYMDASKVQTEGVLKALGDNVKQITDGKLPKTADGKSYTPLTVPGLEGFAAPPKIAKTLNERLTPLQESNKFWRGYDRVNKTGKAVELAGGYFHPLKLTYHHVAQVLGNRQNVVRLAKDIGLVLQVKAGAKARVKELNRLRDSVGDIAQQIGVETQNIMPDLMQRGVFTRVQHGAERATGQTHRFLREVGELYKLRTIESLVKKGKIDLSTAQGRADARSIGEFINNTYGGLNRASTTNALTQGQAKVIGRGLLTSDFTEAKARAVQQALGFGQGEGHGMLRNTSTGTKMARKTVGTAVAMAIAATVIPAYATGRINNPKELANSLVDGILDPHLSLPGNFKTATGKQATIGLPGNDLSEYGKIIRPLLTGGDPDYITGKKDRLSGLKTYFEHRTAFVPSALSELSTNQDWAGRPIIEKNKDTGQTNVKNTALNIAASHLPIPLSETSSVLRGRQTAMGGAVNFIGGRYRTDPLAYKGGPLDTGSGQKWNSKTNLSKTFGKDFANLKNDDERKAWAQQSDRNYTTYQKYLDAKRHHASNLNLPRSLSQSDKSTLNNYNRLTDLERQQLFATQTDAQYKYLQAKYDRDKAAGTITAAEDVKRSKELTKAKVGSKYPKDVRDLYSLSKADLTAYLATNDGKTDKDKQAKQLFAYDKALYDAGLTSYLKFKNGIAPAARGGSRGGSKSKFNPAAAAFKLRMAQKPLKVIGALPAPTKGSAPKFTTPALKTVYRRQAVVTKPTVAFKKPK